MASQHEIRRRSSAADRTVAPVAPLASTSATTTTLAPALEITSRSSNQSPSDGDCDSNGASAMPPPPVPVAGDASPTRHSRATSPASRNANRLSLTLPIAAPSSDPSRPTPTSYVPGSASIPPTPVDSSTVTSPVNANEFIIAIAAQERRVLELREELLRAESELSTLKKQWSSKEVYSRRHESRHSETPRSTTTAPLEVDTGSARQSIDLDRRRLLLQQPNTPTQKGRRVLRGGHARTLSLLSPPKSDPGFAILEDRNYEPVSLPLPPIERRAAQLTNPNLAKRASWQPQSHRQQSNVPGLVEDFRMGLKAFVEDIRQITVGEEPISGSPANAAGQQRPSMITSRSSGDLETIRSSQPARPKVSSTFDIPAAPAASTPPTQNANDGTCQDKPKAGKNKRFSWTPLSFDSVDDSGWSNWDSPASAKSTRWSGSTINSGGAEDIESIPEASEDIETPSKPKSTPADAPLLSPKLGEILPNMVNKFTPSNIKRTANHIMDEWEKSLIEPQTASDKENSY